MALYIETGFDNAKLGAFAIEITEATGPTTINVDLGSAKYCHTDISSIMGGSDYDDLAGALKAAIDAESTASGNGWTYTVTWTRSTGKYVISAAEGNIALDFTSAAELRLALAMGFDSGAHASAASHTSDNSSYYYISGAMGAASDKTDDYEPNGVVQGAEADDGSHYAIARSTAPIYSDFRLLFESKAATFKRSATATVPWTYQHMWEHVRGEEPFLVVDDSESTVHFLRASGASWAPARAAADWDGGWHIPFATYMEGRL